MAEWTVADAAIPCETTHEQELSQCAYTFFCYPGPETQNDLERLIFLPDGGAPIRTAALVIQAANAALAADFEQVTGVLAQQGQTMACGPGCTGCCHQLVLCHPFETELVGLYMHTRPEVVAYFSRTWREWDEQTASFRKEYLRWAEKFYKEGVDDGTFVVQDYFVPCPFLDDGLCRIYPVRPYACRSCVAIDPACRSPQEPHEKPGSHTMDFGSFTPHRKARSVVIGLLWRLLGVQAGEVKSRPMAEQVRLWLESGASALL